MSFALAFPPHTHTGNSGGQVQAVAHWRNRCLTSLSNEMEMKTNLSAVQEYATNTLKMVKMDRSQVTYVTTGQENKVERSDTGLARLAGEISQTVASFMEYLTP